jgi:hypothetical protein
MSIPGMPGTSDPPNHAGLHLAAEVETPRVGLEPTTLRLTAGQGERGLGLYRSPRRYQTTREHVRSAQVVRKFVRKLRAVLDALNFADHSVRDGELAIVQRPQAGVSLQSLVNTSKHITARIDRETAERLARTAAVEDRSQSSVVRRALREHLSEQQAHRHVTDQERTAA